MLITISTESVRSRRGLLRSAVLATAAVVGAPIPAAAQLDVLLNPKLGEAMARADYRYTFYPDERVPGQQTDLRMTQHRVSLFVPLAQDASDELTFSASARLQETDTRALLPDTRERFPKELWDIRFGPTYRHRFENGWIGGATVSAGSASDEPFASGHEVVVRATAFLRVPRGERDAWIFMVNYLNVSEFLEGVPLPGFAYVYSPSERFTAVIGLPFAAVEAKPIENLTLQATYTALRSVRARATYRLFRPLAVYAGFDWDHDLYLRADRQETHDRLFYYEKRLTGGARLDLRHVSFELSGGLAFDRFYFEGKDYGERHHNRIDVKNGPFVVGRVGVRF